LLDPDYRRTFLLPLKQKEVINIAKERKENYRPSETAASSEYTWPPCQNPLFFQLKPIIELFFETFVEVRNINAAFLQWILEITPQHKHFAINLL